MALFPGLKEKVLSGEIQSLNEAQARNLFGTDFTGLQRRGDQFVPDSSAITRLRGTTEQRQFPTVDQFNQAGFASSTLQSEIESARQLSEQNLTRTRAGITSRFGETIERQRGIGEAEVGGIRARLSTLRGVGASSSRLQFIDNQQKENDRFIKELESARETALLNADTASADRNEQRIQTLRDNQFRIRQAKFQEFQALLSESRAQTQEERLGLQTGINLLIQLRQISEGQSITIGGQTFTGLAQEQVNPFFRSQDFISIAKELPVGETRIIVDPNTGQEFEIHGLDQPTANTQTFQSTNKSTGETILTTVDRNTGLPIQQIGIGEGGTRLLGTPSTEPVSPQVEEVIQPTPKASPPKKPEKKPEVRPEEVISTDSFFNNLFGNNPFIISDPSNPFLPK